MDQLTAQMIYDKLMQQLGLGQTPTPKKYPYIGKPDDPTWGAAGSSTGCTGAGISAYDPNEYTVQGLPNSGYQVPDTKTFGGAGIETNKEGYERYLRGLLSGKLQ